MRRRCCEIKRSGVNLELGSEKTGGLAFANSPAEFRKFIAEEVDKWGMVIRTANIKPE
jgi:hypothetical protein